MPPIAKTEEYFAELLKISESEASHSERLQQLELVVKQFLVELDAWAEDEHADEMSVKGYRGKFVDRIGGVLNDPSTSDSAKLVLDTAYSLLTGNLWRGR